MTLISSICQFVSIPLSLSLKGQTVLITGSNTGLGLATARKCVELGATRVILAVRSIAKGDMAKTSIQQSHPLSLTKIDVWDVDLQSFESVLAIGKREATLPRLDAALLNAGVFKFKMVDINERLRDGPSGEPPCYGAACTYTAPNTQEDL